MPWKRANCWYTSQREGDRVVQINLGSAVLGELAAQQAAREATERRQQREEIERAGAFQREAIEAREAILTRLVKAAHIAGGWYEHNRSWRKRPLSP